MSKSSEFLSNFNEDELSNYDKGLLKSLGIQEPDSWDLDKEKSDRADRLSKEVTNQIRDKTVKKAETTALRKAKKQFAASMSNDFIKSLAGKPLEPWQAKMVVEFLAGDANWLPKRNEYRWLTTIDNRKVYLYNDRQLFQSVRTNTVLGKPVDTGYVIKLQ
jgi:hypothetical protein